MLLHRLGIQAMRRGELEHARELVESSHEIHERTKDRWGRAQTIGTLGAIARVPTMVSARTTNLISQSVALAREVGVPWWESGMLAELACLALNSGRTDEAERRARDSLALAEQLKDRPGRIFGVGVLARVAAERGQHGAPAASGVESRTSMLSRRSVAGGVTVRSVKRGFDEPPVPTSSAPTRKAATSHSTTPFRSRSSESPSRIERARPSRSRPSSF